MELIIGLPIYGNCSDTVKYLRVLNDTSTSDDLDYGSFDFGKVTVFNYIVNYLIKLKCSRSQILELAGGQQEVIECRSS